MFCPKLFVKNYEKEEPAHCKNSYEVLTLLFVEFLTGMSSSQDDISFERK